MKKAWRNPGRHFSTRALPRLGRDRQLRLTSLTSLVSRQAGTAYRSGAIPANAVPAAAPPDGYCPALDSPR